jgi:hypothetical protein
MENALSAHQPMETSTHSTPSSTESSTSALVPIVGLTASVYSGELNVNERELECK